MAHSQLQHKLDLKSKGEVTACSTRIPDRRKYYLPKGGRTTRGVASPGIPARKQQINLSSDYIYIRLKE